MNLMTGLKNLDHSEILLSERVQLLPQDQADFLYAAQTYAEIVKVYQTEAMQHFRIYTTISSYPYHYTLQLSLSDNIVSQRVDEIGLHSLLKMINTVNMQDENIFTLMWNDQMGGIVMRASAPKTPDNCSHLKETLQKLWESLGKFVQSFFPVPKKQVWTHQHEKMTQGIKQEMRKWKNYNKLKIKSKTRKNVIIGDAEFKKQEWKITDIDYYHELEQALMEENKKAQKLQRFVTILSLQEEQGDSSVIGNFCDLTVYKSTYIIRYDIISMNKEANLHLLQKEDSSQIEEINKKIKGFLIEKKSLERDIEPFKRQMKIIDNLRDTRCRYMPEYFLEYIEGKQFREKSNKIYMPKYPQKLEESSWKRHRFSISMNIAKGLEFLKENGFIHRDLKPSNIVLTQNSIPKLIDFGSSIENCQQIKPSLPIHPVRTTRRYNMVWEALPAELKKIIPETRYYRHPFFDIYALGKIYEEILKCYNTRQKLGNFLHEYITFLINECTQLNPSERLHPLQIIFYLSIFVKYEKNSLISY